MQRYFSSARVTEFDLGLIALLGYCVTLKFKSGEVACVGRLHTHKINPMGYFSVTPDANYERDQWVFAYGEIEIVDKINDIIILNY